MKNELALEYLKIRGVTKKSIKKFNLGFTYGNLGWKFLKLPLPFFSKKSGKYFDVLSNRIIIPIVFNEVTYGATSRSIFNDNPVPHLHVFGGPMKVFFNHDSLQYDMPIIVVESPFDSIQLDQRGFYSVATMGTNTDYGIESLLGRDVFICFDNDENEAGKTGARILFDKLFNYGGIGKIIDLPKKGKKNDISEFFKTHSKKDFGILMNKAHSLEAPIIKTKIKKHYKPFGERDKKVICCPFHDDSSPSCVIYNDTDSFYCFGCGKSGTLKILEEKLNDNM